MEQLSYLRVNDFFWELSELSKNEGGLIALINCDFNVPSGDKGVKDIFRIERAVPSIRKVIKAGIAPLLASHYERPDGFDDALSLELNVKQYLSEAIGMPVRMIPFDANSDTYDKRYFNRGYIFKNYNKGSLSLLENTRFHPSQTKNDGGLARDLEGKVDIVINIGLGTAHRKEDTNSYLTTLKPSFAGNLLAEELEVLEKFKEPKNPYAVIVGGDKVEDSLKLIEGLLSTEKSPNYILIGGHVMLPFIYASGRLPFEVGLENKVGKEEVKHAKRILELNGTSIFFPEYFAVMRKGNQLNSVKIEKLLGKDRITDIGENSISQYMEIVSKAKKVLWNGPLGMDDENYVQASRKLIDAINYNDGAAVLAGGGSTSYVIRSYKLYGDWFNGYLSTGGGSLISGAANKLPAIEALAESRQKLLKGGYGDGFEMLRTAAVKKIA